MLELSTHMWKGMCSYIGATCLHRHCLDKQATIIQHGFFKQHCHICYCFTKDKLLFIFIQPYIVCFAFLANFILMIITIFFCFDSTHSCPAVT